MPGWGQVPAPWMHVTATPRHSGAWARRLSQLHQTMVASPPSIAREPMNKGAMSYIGRTSRKYVDSHFQRITSSILISIKITTPISDHRPNCGVSLASRLLSGVKGPTGKEVCRSLNVFGSGAPSIPCAHAALLCPIGARMGKTTRRATNEHRSRAAMRSQECVADQPLTFLLFCFGALWA